MRWRAFWYKESLDEDTEDTDASDPNEYYKFPSKRFAPPCDKLVAFEEDFFTMVKSIKFREPHGEFQRSLRKDINMFKNSEKIITFSDKTNNLYGLEQDDYKKILKENITRDYKKCDEGIVDKINAEASDLIRSNSIKGKVPKFEESDAFISIKDHKDQFPTSIPCRLINPAKTHIGKISKLILDKINQQIRVKANLTQWQNSKQVIEWFNAIKDKKKHRFICFDLVSFYPSIKRKHLLDAVEFARQYVDISPNDIEIILHACKTVLISDGCAWQKTNGTDLFDVPMGAFHGAEVCDLVGLHILSQLGNTVPKGTFGLYRDDGLGVIRDESATNLERIAKRIRSLFKTIGFEITIQTGGISTDFLDVTLNLNKESYHPYRKPNANIHYIHNESNHPPHVKRSLPSMIAKRLSGLSKTEEIFDAAKVDYEEELERCGYKNPQLKYIAAYNNAKPRNRRRRKKAIYFNAPFCRSVKTKIGKEFFRIVDRHFTEHHPYHRIFNRKTIKLSYSCMSNVKATIQSHNARLLRKSITPNKPQKTCNCRRKDSCPLNGNCLVEGVIYMATVKTTDGAERDYIGSTGCTFKKRYGGHKYSFAHKKHHQSTELSKYVWKAKEKGVDPQISWKVLHKTRRPKDKPQRVCLLCNLERMEIAEAKREKVLNKRSELTGACVHYRSCYF